MDRTSWLENQDTTPISEERWKKFLTHVERAKRFIPGGIYIEQDRINVNFGYYSEGLAFSRNFKDQYHKTDYRDAYYKQTVAAFFLLFNQDCLENEPNVRFCGSPWDTQEALERLREAGVWEEGKKCLVAFEDIEAEYNETIKAANEIFEKAWNESEIPDAINIDTCLMEEIGRHMPQSFLQGQDYDPFYEDWWINEVLGRFKTFHETYVYCLERDRESGIILGKRWFLNSNIALNFVSDLASQGLTSKPSFFLPKKVETSTSIFEFEDFRYKDLPHDHTFDLIRQLCKLTADSLNCKNNDELTEKIRQALTESHLSEEQCQKALSMSFVRSIKITMPDGEEISHTFLPTASRMNIWRKLIDISHTIQPDDRNNMFQACVSEICEMDLKHESIRILPNGIKMEWGKISPSELISLSMPEQDEEEALVPC